MPVFNTLITCNGINDAFAILTNVTSSCPAPGVNTATSPVVPTKRL